MTDTTEFYNISEEIWEKKYRAKIDGIHKCEDKTIEDTWERTARSIAAKEKRKKFWENKFLSILDDFLFLPGGRILANAGTGCTQTTMFNCYVMNTIEDSLEAIFETVKEAALTQKYGGGVGFDFSTLRPEGALIKGCGAESSGPISFMQVLDATCRTIMSAGHRRGAQMAVLRCDHPDIEKFITAKRNNERLQMFNLSVGITDKFIEAVKKDAKWELSFNGSFKQTVRAVELWDLIMRSTYEFAEPGFILLDKINEMNNLYYCEKICATNPCGEQPLPPYGACLLGSLNLSRFVVNPFRKNAGVNYKKLEEVTRIAVRFLDNVIDVSPHPLAQQEREVRSKRRMGIGITGLADMFIFLRLRYGSGESIKTAEKVMQTITYTAYEESINIATQKGAFKLFDKNKYTKSKFVLTLPAHIRKNIKKFGIRNSHLTSIAPTGTISLLANNVSSGLEPVFAYKYTRRIRTDGKDNTKEVRVADYAYLQYLKNIKKDKIDDTELPDYFVNSENITPDEHLNIQAALQKYVDSSISKTINVPADYPFEDFKAIYMKAYDKGLKGCTTFRPSEHITGVLVKDTEKDKKKTPQDSLQVLSRPAELEGSTYKIKTPLSSDAIYITINDIIDENGKRRPYELFINTKNLQHFSWIVAMTRLISAVFRREPDPSFLVEELRSIYDPNGGYFNNGRFIPSLAADIGYIIEKHLKKTGFFDELQNKNKQEQKTAQGHQNHFVSHTSICPDCNEKALVSQENCLKCLNCGYSKCH